MCTQSVGLVMNKSIKRLIIASLHLTHILLLRPISQFLAAGAPVSRAPPVTANWLLFLGQIQKHKNDNRH